MLSFKGTHFPKDVILYAVFFYVRYGVSYRDLEEIGDYCVSSAIDFNG
jgi:putative transposase